MTAPKRFADSQIPLAPRAPSIHDPSEERRSCVCEIRKASLYEAFPAAEARRLVERFEWHYTPKHGTGSAREEGTIRVSRRREKWISAVFLRECRTIKPISTYSLLAVRD